MAALGGFIGSAIYWAHSILGAALTLALSPVVVLVHVFTFPKARKLKKQVENVWIRESDDFGTTTKTLLQLLSTKKYSLSKIRCQGYQVLADIKDRIYVNDEGRFKSGNYKKIIPRWFFKIDTKQTTQEALESFNALNIGRIHF